MEDLLIDVLPVLTFETVSPEQSTTLPIHQTKYLAAESKAGTSSFFISPPDELTLPSKDPFGFFDYDLLLRFQYGEDIATPTDTIGDFSVAQFFDEQYYLWRYSDVADAVESGEIASGYEHFINHGISEGRDPSVIYLEEFYLSFHTDVQEAVDDELFASGLEHYLTIGHIENRLASIDFIALHYLIENPDVAAAVESGELQSAFEHYVKFGADELRPSFVPLTDTSPFDPFDVSDIVLHILPSELYNEAYYLRTNADVAEAINTGLFANGFEHFVQFGQQEIRNPSRDFDQGAYLMGNADVKAAVEAGDFESGFEHYMQIGRFEYRSFSIV
ncbi:hypothetical protein PN498_11690 [Oscillatoria sp. CS-180]|uniref:hypothetical protein n=1 Tax=Oscillatoria sp. CS-180 TaxID=3021720 RepID=UPI00232DC10B|nr:hypothetical protein [Oscillatoria sp. CS-180]MDB9526655.1 hypothetical protein [Oscillatoria sp. CS-180]